MNHDRHHVSRLIRAAEDGEPGSAYELARLCSRGAVSHPVAIWGMVAGHVFHGDPATCPYEVSRAISPGRRAESIIQTKSLFSELLSPWHGAITAFMIESVFDPSFFRCNMTGIVRLTSLALSLVSCALEASGQPPMEGDAHSIRKQCVSNLSALQPACDYGSITSIDVLNSIAMHVTPTMESNSEYGFPFVASLSTQDRWVITPGNVRCRQALHLTTRTPRWHALRKGHWMQRLIYENGNYRPRKRYVNRSSSFYPFSGSSQHMRFNGHTGWRGGRRVEFRQMMSPNLSRSDLLGQVLAYAKGVQGGYLGSRDAAAVRSGFNMLCHEPGGMERLRRCILLASQVVTEGTFSSNLISIIDGLVVV